MDESSGKAMGKLENFSDFFYSPNISENTPKIFLKFPKIIKWLIGTDDTPYVFVLFSFKRFFLFKVIGRHRRYSEDFTNIWAERSIYPNHSDKDERNGPCLRDGPLEKWWWGGGGGGGGGFSACTIFFFSSSACAGIFFAGETLCTNFFFFQTNIALFVIY